MSATLAQAPGNRWNLVLNAVLFQAGWFACVLGAAKGLAAPGVAVAAVIIAWHLNCAARRAPEARLITLVMVVGLVFETAMLQSGLVTFAAPLWIDGLAPGWIVALWAIFATTLNVSMRWLRDRMWLAVVLGAVSGPLTYYGGERLGALAFTDSGLALGVIALAWAVITPLVMYLAARSDGYSA